MTDLHGLRADYSRGYIVFDGRFISRRNEIA